MRLQNKVAIITGGGSGIGRGTAVRFAQEGAKVMITGRRSKPIEDTVNQIKSEGGEASYLSIDVSKTDQVQHMIDQTMSKYGKLDILVNNAGVFIGIGKTIMELTEEEWDSLMGINLRGYFLCSKYALPHMIENGGGAIVNCSSISGHVGQRKQGAYNAAKGRYRTPDEVYGAGLCRAQDPREFGLPRLDRDRLQPRGPQATRGRNCRHAPHRQGGDARGCRLRRAVSRLRRVLLGYRHIPVCGWRLYRAISVMPSRPFFKKWLVSR